MPCSPLVTVITPSYNQGRFIRATIDSVLSQDYPHIEYIIMDGGSTDETAAVVKDYAGRLTFISEKDRGQSHAINKGFRLARGSILAWLNSDDLYLPGAVSAAVRALGENPAAGAVYGDGYRIDETGRTIAPFTCTEPFDLWKLLHLSDYILQQTVFFRESVLNQIGLLREDYHYTMDWDVLIRIGLRYPLLYIPVYMGAIREYPDAKSFRGGVERVREIRRLLRLHTGRRYPPGYLTYGLETYQKLCCDTVGRAFPAPLARPLQSAVRLVAGTIIAAITYHAQGLYRDGWTGPVLRYMLPPGDGAVTVEGTLPPWPAVSGQTLRVSSGKQLLAQWNVPSGDFRLSFTPPPELHGRTLDLTITSSRWRTMPRFFSLRPSRRSISFRLHRIAWAEWTSSGPTAPG
jgi:hypothetical protein